MNGGTTVWTVMMEGKIRLGKREELKEETRTGICNLFIAASFIVAKDRNNPNINQCMKGLKKHFIFIQWNIIQP